MKAPNGEETIFAAALALPPEDRAAYLDESCGDDGDLRQRVEVLLQAHVGGEFLEEPAAPLAAQTLRISPVISERPGDMIGRYKLLQQIGEGGCGVVYMAEQEKPVQRRVALKVIKLGMDTKQVIARFEAERQALAMMDHPNIAKVLDGGATETGRPYFVMELVRGVKITEYCDHNNLPTDKRLELFMQVCRAIQHAHQKGIIHRDIKPSNILVTLHDGVPVPKVIDFGIAKATQGRLTDLTLFTAFEQFIGTPAYMSPEQAELSGLDIDTRSDIYSLGVLLYELLTGKTPFDAKELLQAGLDEMRRTIREKEPERPSTKLSTMVERELTVTAKRHHTEAPKLISAIRGDLDWIVMKCLEKDRAQRYETANGLAMDVQRHLSNEPVTACPPSNFGRLHKLVRRNKLAFTAAAAVLMSLLIGFAVSTWMYFQELAAKREQARLGSESQQVAQFLKDMLQGVGPSVALGRDTTLLREILEKTAQRVQKDLKAQPLVEAELLTVIGNVFQEINEYHKAEEAHRLALTLRRKALGNDHAETARSLVGLGNAIRRENRPEEAEPLMREALAIRRKVFGPEHPEVADSLDNLARVIADQNHNPAEVEALSREALAMRLKLFGERHADVAKSYDELAGILSGHGKFDEAEALRREALAMRLKLFGERHADVAQSYDWLALTLSDRGKFDEAVAACRTGLELRRELFGEENPAVAGSLNTLAGIRRAQGRLDEAEEVYRRFLEMTRKMNGAESWSYAFSLQQFGRILEARGSLEEAEARYRESVALFRKLAASGGTNPRNRLWQTLQMLGRNLRTQGKLVEANEAFREVLALLRDNAEHGDQRAMTDVGNAYHVGEGVAKDAKEAVRWTRMAAEKGHPNAQFNLGVAYAHGEGVQQDYAEALKWYRLAADQGLADAQNNLGAMYHNGHGVAQDDIEAVRWFRKAAEQSGPEAEFNLGDGYRRGQGVSKDPAQAFEWFQKAALHGQTRAQLRLSEMYQLGEGVAKDPAEALKWRRKAAEKGDAAVLNELAWASATSQDPNLRNGACAIDFAQRALAAVNSEDTPAILIPAILDTLAAAYAEAAQFDNATKTQKEAIALLTDEEQKKDFMTRLKLYESNTPYHEH
jgi:serine/threonine protein kinase/TPR repeat protein